MSDIEKFNQLPSSFKILALQNTKTGVCVAHFLDYDIVTEADDLFELIINVNDLIYTYFGVPERLRSKIKYLPPEFSPSTKGFGKTDNHLEKEMVFSMLVAPRLLRNQGNV